MRNRHKFAAPTSGPRSSLPDLPRCAFSPSSIAAIGKMIIGAEELARGRSATELAAERDKLLLGVLKAVALGVPLPLCSCGVIPAALGLRRDGAGCGHSGPE